MATIRLVRLTIATAENIYIDRPIPRRIVRKLATCVESDYRRELQATCVRLDRRFSGGSKQADVQA